MDLIFLSAVPMYMNRELDVEYLNYCRGLKGEMSLLRMNLLVMLTSSELIAQNRFLAIMYYTALRPLRWLAGKTHEFAEYGWGARHMGLVLDIFLGKMEFLRDNPTFILNEDWMMTMFHGLFEMLPPLRDYYRETFSKQSRYLVGRDSGAKVMPHCIARKRLFRPVDKTNRNTNKRLIELVGVVMPNIISEMLNPKKRT